MGPIILCQLALILLALEHIFLLVGLVYVSPFQALLLAVWLDLTWLARNWGCNLVSIVLGGLSLLVALLALKVFDFVAVGSLD